MHTPTIIAGVLGKGDVLVGCALKILSGPICDAVIPLTLTDSEILSHDAGIMVLRSALDRLQNGPSADTSTECTWDEIARSAPAKVPQPPAGLFDRLWLLTERLARGATP